MRPLGIHHVSVNVDDVDAALRFYVDVLGLSVRDDRPDFGFGGAWLDVGSQQVHLIEAPPPDDRGQHLAIHVGDLDAAVADVRAQGRRRHGPGPGRDRSPGVPPRPVRQPRRAPAARLIRRRTAAGAGMARAASRPLARRAEIHGVPLTADERRPTGPPWRSGGTRSQPRGGRPPGFSVHVVFEQGDLRVGDGIDVVPDLEPGRVATWRVVSMPDLPDLADGVTCRVQRAGPFP